jgi:hypothetical protein
MRKRQFTIRTLMIVTLLVAVSLPTAISQYDNVTALFFPPPKPTAASIIPLLIGRVDPSNAITIRPGLPRENLLRQ